MAEIQRYGSIIGIKPENIEKYAFLHANPRKEVNDMIKKCNIQNYSIYYKDGFLFSYFEYVGDDYQADMDKMAQDPATQAWWEICKPLQEPLNTRQNGEWWADMREVYHLN